MKEFDKTELKKIQQLLNTLNLTNWELAYQLLRKAKAKFSSTALTKLFVTAFFYKNPDFRKQAKKILKEVDPELKDWATSKIIYSKLKDNSEKRQQENYSLVRMISEHPRLARKQFMKAVLKEVDASGLSWTKRLSIEEGCISLTDFKNRFFKTQNLVLEGNIAAGTYSAKEKRSLLISGQNICKIGKAILSKLSKIQYVDLSNNAFETIPEELYQEQNIEFLYLHRAGTKLRFAEDFSNWTKLCELQAPLCGLEKIPTTIGACQELQIINLNSNKLQTLPESIWKLPHLLRLELPHNQLRQLSAAIGGLTALRILHLHGNLITKIPDSIGKLVDLEILYLANNKLKQLPQKFGQLAKLETLNLCDNQLQTIPDCLPQLHKLRSLDLSRNPINWNRAAWENIIAIPQLEHLYLGETGLTTIPDEIRQLSKLKTLSCFGNKALANIPKGLRQLRWLQFLDLGCTGISKSDQRLFSGYSPFSDFYT